MSENFIFGNQWYLLLLILPLIILFIRERRGGAAFGAFALLRIIARPSRGPKIFRSLMALGLALLIIAAARPQFGSQITEYNSKGRDLMLVIDLSGSMSYDDMTDEDNNRITRLQSVITAAKVFIDGRPNDRIGLVFFSQIALSSCPATNDHSTLKDILGSTQEKLESLWETGEDLLGQNTNIGLGLGYALKALIHIDNKDQDLDPTDEIHGSENINKKSLGRAIILITDGKDSYGKREPLIAARHARDNHIRIYAIGVGKENGTVTQGLGVPTSSNGRIDPIPIGPNQLPNMNFLKSICKISNGAAMAAGDPDELTQVFKEIDLLEPTPRDQRTRNNYSDHFDLPLLIGLALCALALLCEPRLRGGLS